MSGGVAVDFSALSKAGTSLAAGLEQNRLSGIAQAMGAKVQAGDYAGAAADAFAAGDLQTGLSLVKLGESKAQTADFQKSFGGGGLAGLMGGGTAPATGMPAPVAPGNPAPSFTDASGPAGSYLATLRGKESGGNATAKNPNSSATGIDQFTASTWAGLAKKYPELGLTPDGRTDVAQSTRAMERFTRDNANALTAAGVPITPGNLYVSHFLGQGGGPRFIRGVMQNPDAPATAYVDPAAAAANRTIFYNRDGTPKTAGAVYAERTSRFGGAAPAAPAGRVQVASADRSFVPQMPSPADGASASPVAQVFGGADVKAIPPEADPVPAEQRVQVAQAVPQVLAQAGMKPAAVAQVQQMAPGSPERINYLVKAMSHPAAPEGFKDAAKAILANELQISRLSEEQQAYQADVAQGFKGTTMQWRAEKAAATRAPEAGPVDVQKYEYAKKQGYAGTLIDFLKTEAEARSTKINNTVNGSQPTNKQLEKVQGDLGDEQTALMKASRAAPSQLASIGVMEKLLDDPTLYAGTFGQLATEGKRALASLGLGAADGARANEGFQKLSSQFILDKAGGSLGAGFSNADRSFIGETGPQISNTPAGNKLILEMAKRTALRTQEIGRQARAYADSHGGLLDNKFFDQIEQYGQANPVFQGLENMASAPGVLKPQGAPQSGQREASTGALKPVPSDLAAHAREALKSGAPAKAVFQRLREQGFDPNGLAP